MHRTFKVKKPGEALASVGANERPPRPVLSKGELRKMDNLHALRIKLMAGEITKKVESSTLWGHPINLNDRDALIVAAYFAGTNHAADIIGGIKARMEAFGWNKRSRYIDDKIRTRE